MSRLSRYSFEAAKYSAVNRDSHFPPDEPLEDLVAKHEKEINDILAKCHENAKSWKHIKRVYRLIEAIAIIATLSLSIVSVVLAGVFFPEYQLSFQYIKQIGLIQYKISSYLPLFYLVLERIGAFFDILRSVVSYRIFRMFAHEKEDQKLMAARNTNTDDYMLIYSENSITIKTINNLRLRVNLKTQLKKMLRSLVRMEVLNNFYFHFMMIAPKILVGSYLQINFMGHFQTPETEEMDNSYGVGFKCCSNFNETLTAECSSQSTSACINSEVKFYLQLLIVVFFTTAILKFLLQVLLAANLKLNLIDRIVNERYVEEINLKRKYEHNRSASFSMNVRSRIEENDAKMASQLEMLEMHRLLPISEQKESINYYAEISN